MFTFLCSFFFFLFFLFLFFFYFLRSLFFSLFFSSCKFLFYSCFYSYYPYFFLYLALLLLRLLLLFHVSGNIKAHICRKCFNYFNFSQHGVVFCSCNWWAISFITRVDGVFVDPRMLPMKRISTQSLQLPGPMFRVLDVDPTPGSFIDAEQGFSVTFADLPTFWQFRLIIDAITAFYRSGTVTYLCFIIITIISII